MPCPLCDSAVLTYPIDLPDGRFHAICAELWEEGHRTFPSLDPEDEPCGDDACLGTYCGRLAPARECDQPCCGGAPAPTVTSTRERAAGVRACLRSDRRWRARAHGDTRSRPR